MALYLWGGQLLIRTWGGVTGLAIAEACCCKECCCDDLPDTLYAKITHWNQDLPPAPNFLTTKYVTLSKYTVSDGCSCPPSPLSESCVHKEWHGIYTKQLVGGFPYVLYNSQVHIVIRCEVSKPRLVFTIRQSGTDYYGVFPAYCDSCDMGVTDDCEGDFLAESGSIACDITYMGLKTEAWT